MKKLTFALVAMLAFGGLTLQAQAKMGESESCCDKCLAPIFAEMKGKQCSLYHKIVEENLKEISACYTKCGDCTSN